MSSKFPKIPFLFSIILFLVSVFAFFFLYKEIEFKNDEAHKSFVSWEKEATRREDIRQLDHSVKIIESERMDLETHFAKSSDVVPFLDSLENLARLLGIKAEIVAVTIATDGTGLVVNMKTSGNFSALYKFLKLLENSSYQIEFTSVNLNKETAGDNKVPGWNLSLTIKLKTFTQ